MERYAFLKEKHHENCHRTGKKHLFHHENIAYQKNALTWMNIKPSLYLVPLHVTDI